MKHNLLKSLIISVILLMGVSNAWALDIYLDISSYNWSENSSVIKLYPGTGSDVVGTNIGTVSVYKFTVPSATGTISFKQYNSSGTGYPSNEASITYNSDHNVYKLTGWKSVNYANYNISEVNPTNYIYFDNSITQWTSNKKYFAIGHDQPAEYSICRPMTNIPNTQLWYTTQINTWKDATYYAFFADAEAWDENLHGWGINDLPDADTYVAPYTSHKPLNKDKYYLCVPTSKEKNKPFNLSEHSSYNTLNYTLTIKSAVKSAAAATHTEANSKASIAITSYKLTGNDVVAQQDASIATSARSTTITAAHTATTTLTVSGLEHGYKFDGWYTEEGQLLSKETTHTYYPTASATIYARFREACEIMLDPFPYGEYGVRINGVEFLCHPSKTKTTEVPIGTTVEIINKKPTHEFWDFNPKYKYSVVAQPKGESVQEITSSTYTMNKDVNFGPNYGLKEGYRIYLHIPTNLTGENQWNTKPSNKEYDYYDNFIYAYDHLSHWQIWEGDGQEGKVIGELVRMTKDKYLSSLGDGEYWYVDIPAGYHTFIFERKEPNIGENTHRDRYTETFAFEMPFTEGNCYTLNKQEGEYFTGTWGTIRKPDPSKTHKVTLGLCEFGKYGVIYDGVEHYSRLPQTLEEFEVPDGAVLTFIEGTPSSDAYDGGIVLSKPEKQKIDITQSFTVYSDVTFDDNFVTKKPYNCYLAVPDNLSEWHYTEGGKKAEYFIWRHNDMGSFEMIGKTHQGVYQYSENGYKYYLFTILEGCNKLTFQHKFPEATDTENNNNYTYQSVTIDKFSIPTTDVNCFVLTGPSSGYWTKLPARNGDYRLLYVEQVVEKDKENNTVITRKKAHPSDVIKKGIALDTVSLHVYRERSYQGIKRYDEEGPDNNKKHDYYTTKASNAGIILQQWNGSKWIDLSHHMVFGPLEAVPEIALLPGRKNAVSSTNSTGYEYLYYDDGIENIKNDDHLDKGDGVWNFIVEQNNGTATIALDRTYRYTGKYYIRTAAASGGWNTYTLPDNYMTRSDVSKKNSNYSHYFVQWIIKDENVSFTIANDYGCAISDTLDADRTDLWGNQLANDKIMVGADKVLPANANVRFSWNEKTNFIHRAYIAGTTHVHDRYLVLTGKEGDNKLFGLDGQQLPAGQDGDPRYGLTENEEIFKDISNWVYYADVKMIPGAAVQLTAKYNGKTQYFIGNQGQFSNTILQGTGGDKYLIRMLYDFKTNELISAYVPPGNQKENVHLITTNLMIIRQNNGEAKQLVFNNGDMGTRSSDRTGYGVIEFVEDTLRNESIPYLKRCLYWISFPFDVDLTEAFGSMVYGKHWLIQEYDGAKRAAEGYWLDNDNFWKLHWDQNITLKAGHGYVLEIDINQMIKDYIIDITDTKTQVVGLYFPSKDPITREIIKQNTYTVTMDSHKCNIVHAGPLGDRTIRDSHWNVIGVPSYVNTGATFSDKTYALTDVIKYYYRWDGYKDAYTAMEATGESYNFRSTYAYMVQFAGDITWTSVLQEEGPASIVAKKNSNQQQVYAIKLELQQDGNEIDKTFVRLQDEDVTRSFDFNYDLCKIINAGANIYSIITEENSPVNVAANVLPIEETIIPLGIKLDATGEYTFAMPNGTDGIVVELIDYETNTRTNMLLDNYTVNLGKGTFDNRFALHVKPDKTTTSVDNLGNEATGDKVKKYLIDGVLYMQKDGVLYDAQGKLVR